MTTEEALPWPFECGKTVIDDRFLVESELGQLKEGGMGRCLQVRQLSIDKVRLMKILRPDLHPSFEPPDVAPKKRPAVDASKLIVNEARMASRVRGSSNEEFAEILDARSVLVRLRHKKTAGTVDIRLPYIVMESLEGKDLEDILRSRRGHLFPIDEVYELCLGAATALSLVHERGIAHRDFKPGNLFLAKRHQKKPIVKLVDFGIASPLGDRPIHGTGTPKYMSPERLLELDEVEGTASDDYALAIVFFEIAALVDPYWPIDPAIEGVYSHAHIWGTPACLTKYRTDADPLFVNLIQRGLSKEPEARPPTREYVHAMHTIIARRRASGFASSVDLSPLLDVTSRHTTTHPSNLWTANGTKLLVNAGSAQPVKSDVFAMRDPSGVGVSATPIVMVQEAADEFSTSSVAAKRPLGPKESPAIRPPEQSVIVEFEDIDVPVITSLAAAYHAVVETVWQPPLEEQEAARARQEAARARHAPTTVDPQRIRRTPPASGLSQWRRRASLRVAGWRRRVAARRFPRIYWVLAICLLVALSAVAGKLSTLHSGTVQQGLPANVDPKPPN